MLSQVFASLRAYFCDATDADLRALSDAALDDIGLMRADLTTLRPKAEPAHERPLAFAWPFSDLPTATAHAA